MLLSWTTIISSLHMIFELWAISDLMPQLINSVAFDLARILRLRPRLPILRSFTVSCFATCTYSHAKAKLLLEFKVRSRKVHK